MLKNIAASALTALCILAVSASAGAQGVVNGVTGAAEDIANGVADAGRDIADGIMGIDAGDPGVSDPNSSDLADSDNSEGLTDPDSSNEFGDKTEAADAENSDNNSSDDSSDDTSDNSDDSDNSGAVLGGADGSNPDTGISFGYIAGAAVLGALGVAVTVNKRRS